MNKDRIVIEDGRVLFVMERTAITPECSSCKAVGCCAAGSAVHPICMAHHYNGMGPQKYRCISVTKIEPEPKMYFAWNREEARHLVGKTVEFNDGKVGSEWTARTLVRIDKTGTPFITKHQGGILYFSIISEIQTIKLTRAELNERYGVPDNVVIVEGD